MFTLLTSPVIHRQNHYKHLEYSPPTNARVLSCLVSTRLYTRNGSTTEHYCSSPHVILRYARRKRREKATERDSFLFFYLSMVTG